MVIGAGLGSLFLLMGLAALAAAIESAISKNNKLNGIDKNQIRDEQKWDAEHQTSLNEEGQTSAAPDEFIQETEIPEIHPWNNEAAMQGYNTFNEFRTAAMEAAPLTYPQLKEMIEKWKVLHPGKNAENGTSDIVINPGENAGEEVGFPNSGLYEDGTSDVVITPGQNAGNGTSDIVINPGENAGEEVGFPNSGLYEDGTSIINPNQGQSDVKPPMIENEVKDETGKNEEFTIQGNDLQSILDMINKDFQEQRAYEEKIRKEVQEREDNAYQRAVADMRKAGINPNLINLVQSASGGGIVQPSKKDYSLWQTEVSKNLALLEQQIELNFKGEEADKDRLIKTITSVMGLIAIGARMK